MSGLKWINKPAQLAKWCAVWTYNNGGGSTRGGCCPVGYYMNNGRCTPYTPDLPKPPTPLNPSNPVNPPPPVYPVGTYLINGQCIPCIPSPSPCPHTCGNGHGGVEPSCTCTNYPVCGYGKYLGIKYGHCYIISFSDGEQLGLDRDHTDCKKNGFFVDIPFKVSHSTADCSRGNEVEIAEPFFLQDQHGLYKDPQSTKG